VVSPSAAEDLALLGYLAIVGLNLAYIVGALLNGALGPYLALLLAAKDPYLYLSVVALACAVVWLEVAPHPIPARARRTHILSRNMLVLALITLAMWFAVALVVPGGGLWRAVAILREGRFIPLTALTLLLAGLLPGGFPHLPALFRDLGGYLLLALSPLLLYAIWRVNLLGPYIGLVAALLLAAGFVFIFYESRKRGV